MTRFSVDLRLIEIEYELWALGQFLEFIEPQIQYLHDQDRIRTFAQLREAGWDHDEAELDLASQEIRERQQYVVPRFMRGPFIVALSACFQAGLTELANYKKRELDAPLSLNEIRAEDYLKQARRYFEAVLQMPVDLDEARYSRLSDMLLIRNSLAHANGQRRAMSANAWHALTDALKRRCSPADESRGVVILTAEYVKNAYTDVNACLRDLVHRCRGGPAVRKLGPA
jgi:hypothetical protein